ncbi:hypothetical protein DFQ28_001992 [Apophysomyces sp. BC1034]|nr:hypothetical protein DFQ28_001992 [Apophysomyces sp. BC1034]
MGNISSKKHKDRPSVIRTDIPDNEASIATATSLNSILVGSNLSSVSSSPGAQNANKSSWNREQSPNNNSLTIQDQNQLTYSSQNQLTDTSILSIGRTLDIDECISRLLEVGMSAKVSKSICFRNSEIVAICQAAQEVFMSQPVSPSALATLHIKISVLDRNQLSG